MLETHAHTVFV